VISTGGRLVPVDTPGGPVSGPAGSVGATLSEHRGHQAPASRAVRLMSVLERPVARSATVHVSELTTAASVYAVRSFMAGARVSGPSRGLGIAADTVQNLSETATGKPSFVIGNSPNGNATEALATMNTVANVLASCTRGAAASCGRLFAVARAPGQPQPLDTLQAAHNIASRPAHAAARLVRLQRQVFSPALGSAPRALTIALVYTAGGFNAPGRLAFDARGRIWANNNFLGAGTAAGRVLTALSPTGTPILGSPIRGGGISGSGFGIAVDPRGRVWLSNFTSNTTSLFDSRGRALSPPGGFTQGDLVRPQGMAVSRDGTVWIANMRGDHLTRFPGGDPQRAQTITGAGLGNSFSIAVDGAGAAWVTNGALTPTPGSVTRVGPGGTADLEVTGGGLSSPMGIAVDGGGNKWVANFFNDSVTRIDAEGRVSADSPIRTASLRGPWGVAIDGDDNVWVAGFRGRTLTQLCGRTAANCPPGTAMGEAISPPRGYTSRGFQHTTAVQVDQAGNVWLANNWSTATPIANFLGGNGLIQFVGAGAPVATPLVGVPRRP
jgi:streptogramin lyase